MFFNIAKMKFLAADLRRLLVSCDNCAFSIGLRFLKFFTC